MRGQPCGQRRPRNRPGFKGAAAALRPSRLGILPKSPARPQLAASYRVPGALELGCPARRAETRPLFSPGTAEPPLGVGRVAHNGLHRRGRRKPGSGAGPEATLGLRRRKPSLPVKGGRGRRFCGPRFPSSGSWAPEHGRLRPAAAGAGREGTGKPKPGRPAKRSVFPGPRGARGTCMFVWWEWITGKLDGRYHANRYCLGVNSL